MLDFYDIQIIPVIMNTFKVKKIVISGLSNKNINSEILKYCKDNDASYIAIDSEEKFPKNYINDYTLNALPNLNDYDAIFINDDPNWYTVYNELNIIKKNNKNFPLVFICNNVFPHRRRDSYINPDIIPKEFLNKFTKEYKLNDEIYINDNYYHAIEENSPKNGVLTAIEDFLENNKEINMFDVHLLNGMSILYFNDSINQIRIGKLQDSLKGYALNQEELTEEIIDNQNIKNYISKSNISNSSSGDIENFKLEIKKNKKIIKNYEDKIKHDEDEINYKNSQIASFDSKLNLKESQIKNIESKLTNSENKIIKLNTMLQEKDIHINSLNNELALNEKNFKNKENKLEAEMESSISEIESLKRDFSNKELELKELHTKEIEARDNKLMLLQQQYTNQFSKLENKEYCISCFKEEIENNHVELKYLKTNSITRKLLNPFSYLYLIIKSNKDEISLNLKLYKALKDSKCFDIGYYLSKNKDIQESKWCKYFSPELHYVCRGFNEKREFNKKYYDRHSKKELLDYLLNCDK